MIDWRWKGVAATEGDARQTARSAVVWELPELFRLKEPQRRVARYGILTVAAGLLLFLLLGEMGRQAGPAAGGQAPEAVPGTGDRVWPGAGADAASAEDAVARLERELAGSLEKILGQVEGVGQVRVQVALAGALEREYVTDRTMQTTTTQERDPAGASRLVTQAEESGKVVAVQGGGGQEPVLRRMRRPEARGVLVVAEGAADPVVEAELARAVQTALDVPLYRVTILPGKAPLAAWPQGAEPAR